MSQDLSMTKNGIDVEVRVNTVSGNFEATVGDERLAAPTWTELGKLIDKATKRVAKTVNIPFTWLDPQVKYTTGEIIAMRPANGTATGLHSGNGNVLTQIKGQLVQLSRYERSQGEFYRPLTQAEVDTYRRLLADAQAASRAVRDWQNERKIDLHELVVKTLNEGVAPTE